MVRLIIKFIESHGKCVKSHVNGGLSVLNVYIDGTEEWETIPATMKAARDWLGY